MFILKAEQSNQHPNAGMFQDAKLVAGTMGQEKKLTQGYA